MRNFAFSAPKLTKKGGCKGVFEGEISPRRRGPPVRAGLETSVSRLGEISLAKIIKPILDVKLHT